MNATEESGVVKPKWCFEAPESGRELLAMLTFETVERITEFSPSAGWETLCAAVNRLQQSVKEGEINKDEILAELDRLTTIANEHDTDWSNYETQRVDLACWIAPVVADALRRDPVRDFEEIVQEALDNLAPILKERDRGHDDEPES